MELDKPLGLPAVLGAETSVAEYENHRMLSLEFGELPVFRGVVGKLIVGEDGPGNNVRSHLKSSAVGARRRIPSPGYVSMLKAVVLIAPGQRATPWIRPRLGGLTRF